MLMQTLKNSFTKYWILLLKNKRKEKKGKKKKKIHICIGKSGSQEVIIIFSGLPYVVHLLFLV